MPGSDVPQRAQAHLQTCIEFKGSITSSQVAPRIIIQRALDLGAVAIILCHNHPSQNSNASSQDRDITNKIKSCCNNLEITLHDHIILAGDNHSSLADMGMI